jgi:OFA family oxalate/formate antiporter-like MFS transporter
LAGGSCGTGLLLIASSLGQNQYELFHWLYCFGWGIASGLSFYAPMHQGWGFFPDKPGFASGLIISGFGGGGLLFNNLTTKIINPHNYHTDDERYKLNI